MSKPDYYVIQYRVADGSWKHGRSVETWVFEDKAVLRDQRRYTVEAAREAEGGVAERITTRVLRSDWVGETHQRRQIPLPQIEVDIEVHDRPIPAVLGETEWATVIGSLRAQFDGAAHRLADRITADVLTR